MTNSLRWRLPLLIATVIIFALGTFLGIAYQAVRASTYRAASTRAQGIADQLADMLTQSTQQRFVELGRLASNPAVRDLVEHPSDGAREAARASLKSLVTPAPQIVEVWNAAGERVMSWPSPANAVDTLPEGTRPIAPAVAPLQRNHDTIFGESIVEILSDAPGAPGQPREKLGFLVVRRTVAATPGDALSKLVGQGATIALGNKTGGVWTNLTKLIDPPPVNLAVNGVSEYRSADGQRRIGALADIRNTPWAVWVEFPYSLTVAPAQAFLRRMVLVALVFIAFSTIAISVLTARITTPLHELTQASEAIAAGEYSRRVAMKRSDEIGRLSVAFNSMTEQVAQAHNELEDRVRERTDELDRFFSLSLDLLCIADAEGRFVRVNPAWEDVLGWSSEDLTSRPFNDFVHPDDRAATAAESAKLAAGATTLSFENRYRHKEGSYRWLSWKAAPDPRGLIYAAARDITEEKRAATQLEQRAVELAAVNRELEAFSYSVSHDLRSPLRHITGFATMLGESSSESMDAESRRYLQTIVGAATRMGQLIDDLLSFSRVGRVQLAQTRVDLNQIARDAQREVTADLHEREVQWQFHELPVVEGDRAMLRQVFVNLLSNALKYSSTRKQTTIEVGTQPHGSSEAVIFVRDNGVGFDMQYADKLFGVFQRLHRADEFEGTGIGLANVRRIVQRHGGRTWADGRPDHGATFYFSIPMERTRVA